MTVKEAAAWLGVPLSTLYEWLHRPMANGQPVLPSRRLYRRRGIRIKPADLERVFDRLEGAHAPRCLSFFENPQKEEENG